MRVVRASVYRWVAAGAAAGLYLITQGLHTSAWAGAFPDRVNAFLPGAHAGFGAAFFPQNVLGPPNGTTNAQVPNASQQDLLALGTGGAIVLEFVENEIVDGPGADFTVFENPVQPIADPSQSFVDSAMVAISENGVDWYTYPFDLISTRSDQLVYKANYMGFAGVQPSFSSPTNGISPFDPSVSGGDKFDLAGSGLQRVRFIRIKDTGAAGSTQSVDATGDIVTDYRNQIDPDPASGPGGTAAGFDLDAVAAIHSVRRAPAAAYTEWQLYE